MLVRPLLSRTLALACLLAPLFPVAAAEDPSGIIKLEIHDASTSVSASTRGERALPGESEAELNARLLREFGPHPYGKRESAETVARREEARERIAREAREDLLFQLQARALKRSVEDESPDIRALIPSRRFADLSLTIKNPQLLRDQLERRVQEGDLSPYDLLDAEQGLFDPTRREYVADPLGYPGYYGRPLPDDGVIQELLTYQNYLRAERYARYYR